MFCGSAAGDFLPPMIVYKAQYCYEGWHDGAVYDFTPSGWFDARIFQWWFFKLFVKKVSSLSGEKVMIIGDNLASHFSPSVISACNEMGNKFISLIPNTTHLCQPLDVAVIRPLKQVWRTILVNWRKERRNKGTIPKEIFPLLLDRAVVNLKKENLISGFKACGIVPKNMEQVLKRLPGTKKERLEKMTKAS